MNKKQDALKIKSMLLAMLLKQSFKAKIVKTQSIDPKNYENLPLKNIKDMPSHIRIYNNKTNESFDIFCEIYVVSGGYGFTLKIGDKPCDLLSQDDMADVYKMAYNRVHVNNVQNQANEFISYLQGALYPRQVKK
ncbi:MAG: hypothetical protein K5912_03440 [Alphaproteobacteria bacterium]|nr:hypothetical protein [Alphaproteobacteria bacterium]